MRCSRLNLFKLSSLVLLMVAVGCAKKDTGMGDQPQPTENAADRIRELEEKLAKAEGDLIVNQEKMLQMQTELDRLKGQVKSDTAGWSGVPGGTMTSIEGKVLFDSGKADLKPSAKDMLKGIAATIKSRFGGREIYVFGHTDAEPIRHSGWKDNYELSCQRALTVVRFLRSSGVTGYVAACGWGEHRSTADNKGNKGRQADRRVEIFAMESGQ